MLKKYCERLRDEENYIDFNNMDLFFIDIDLILKE